MKILYLPFAVLCGLSIIRDAYAEEPEASCQDDLLYTYRDNDEIALTCGEIRKFEETRQELCVIEDVKMHCPFSCGVCCEDNGSFIINCEWIAEEGWRKVEYCGQTFEHRMVQEMCPVACDYCFESIEGTITSSPTKVSTSPTASPAPTHTQSPTAATIPIRFEGIKEAVSIERGIIELEWDEPILDDNLPFDISDVFYHIFVATIEFNFTDVLNLTDIDSLVNTFSNEVGFQYKRTSDLYDTIISTYYGIRHHIFVIAEAQGILSSNTRSFSVILSDLSPVLYSNVTLQGIFVATDSLDISLQGYDMKFSGALLANHLAIEIGDFVTGMTTSDDPFIVKILQIISKESDYLHILVYPAEPMEDLIEELYYSAEFLLESEDNSSETRRHLFQITSLLSRLDPNEETFIGDRFTGIMTATEYLESRVKYRSLRTRSWELWDWEKTFPEEGGDYYLKLKSTGSATAAIEKRRGRKSIKVQVTNSNTVSAVFDVSIGTNVRYPQDANTPLWLGPLIDKSVRWRVWPFSLIPLVKLDFQVIIEGYITIEAGVDIKGSVDWTTTISPYVKASTYSPFVERNGTTPEHTSDVTLSTTSVPDFATASIAMKSSLTFKTKARVYWKVFEATLGAAVDFNLNAAVKQYSFYPPTTNVLALDELDIELESFKIFVTGSSLFKKGLFFDKNLYDYSRIIFQLPQETWSSPNQECIVSDDIVTAKINDLEISQIPSDTAPMLSNGFQGAATWFAIEDLAGWLKNQVSDYSIELSKNLPANSEEAPEVEGKVYAFIFTETLPEFLPVAYDIDIDLDSASCMTEHPSFIPSMFPSVIPSDIPSKSPSDQPTSLPTSMPSDIPSSMPSSEPSDVFIVPSDQPSQVPSKESLEPSHPPSLQPSLFPTSRSSAQPSPFPSLGGPTDFPSFEHSKIPTMEPSPTSSLTSPPSEVSSPEPSRPPSPQPSPQRPTSPPSCFEDSSYQFENLLGVLKKCRWIGENLARIERYCIPSRQLRKCPVTCGLCEAPSFVPSDLPSQVPSILPSDSPSMLPSESPSQFPTPVSDSPSLVPSMLPSDIPSQLPTPVPSPHGPTSIPSKSPTLTPTLSIKPSPFPSPAPFTPTSLPTKTPTHNPSPQPTPCDPTDQVFSYTRQNGVTETDMCAWVASSTTRITRFCGQSTFASAEVFAKCPVTCSTLASRPNADPCSDLPETYTFPALNTDDTFACSFLTQSSNAAVNKKRKETYCTPEQQLTACAESCGVCDKCTMSSQRNNQVPNSFTNCV